MTTPVNSFDDILSALQQNPELRDRLRRHILTEELLQLPAQYMALRADVDQVKTDLVPVPCITRGRADIDPALFFHSTTRLHPSCPPTALFESGSTGHDRKPHFSATCFHPFTERHHQAGTIHIQNLRQPLATPGRFLGFTYQYHTPFLTQIRRSWKLCFHIPLPRNFGSSMLIRARG